MALIKTVNMNVEFQDIVPQDFNNDSRVWIYQSNRAFTLAETLEIDELLLAFTSAWKSHGTDVKGFGKIFFGQFIILMADETAAGVSGCSTDSSVRLIKNIELDYSVSLFDRQTLAFLIRERIQLIPLAEVGASIDEGMLSKETLYFNNTVNSKKELLGNWLTPLKHSWLAKRYLSLTENY